MLPLFGTNVGRVRLNGFKHHTKLDAALRRYCQSSNSEKEVFIRVNKIFNSEMFAFYRLSTGIFCGVHVATDGLGRIMKAEFCGNTKELYVLYPTLAIATGIAFYAGPLIVPFLLYRELSHPSNSNFNEL